MEPQPLVSVIIPSFNSGEYVIEAIEGVLGQTYGNIEIIIIDDGSTDDTKKKLRKYIDNQSIRYLYQDNKGVSVARNTGISNSKGTIIALCDADDIWLPQKLSLQVSLFNTPDVGLVYGDIKCFGDITDINMEHSDELQRGDIFNELMMGNFICASSTLIRKDVLNEIGGFDVDLEYVEDLDLWLRITSKYKVDFTTKCVVKYRLHGNNASSNFVKLLSVEVDVIRRACVNFSLTKELTKKFLYQSYWRLAYFSAENKNYSTAFNACLSAIHLKPLKISNIKLFLKIMLRR